MSEEETALSRVAIGISFGNSYSSIAYTSGVSARLRLLEAHTPMLTAPAQEGKAEVIANEEGDRQIPSILSYVQGEEFQGTQAKSQLVRNPRNTVAYFRDLVGKEYVWPMSGSVVREDLLLTDLSLQLQIDRPHAVPQLRTPPRA